MSLAACGNKEVGLDLASKTSAIQDNNVYEVPLPGSYDSKGTAIITKISELNHTISFYDYSLGKSYTLSYDGVTRFADKYNTAMSIGQLQPGTMVDISFLKSDKLLVSLRENKDAFSMTDLTGFSFNTNTKVFTYKEDSYRIDDSTILLNEDGKASFGDLNSIDRISITGIDTTIYAIRIDEGHGYLSFKNDEYFIGGFCEIGKDIQIISDNMFITLPEGNHDVHISAKGVDAVKKISITPGEEHILDLGDIEIEEAKMGQVIFVVDPEEAAVLVDGKVIDLDKILELEYGLHQVVVSAKGYDTLVRYLKVAEEKATLTITLDKTEVENSTKKEEEISKTDGYYVYITSPSDVEVYVDNVYIGMSPVAFAKKSGTHSITLRKTGYVTRSFNVAIENTAEDVRYAFDSLTEEVKNQVQDDTDAEEK